MMSYGDAGRLGKAVKAGLLSRCPVCGEGPLYARYLKIRSRCTHCGADFSSADTGDGPAFFVMFLALILLTPAALIFEIAVRPPIWVHGLVWVPLTVGLCMALLPSFKAVMFALQIVHGAEEGRLEK